MLRSPTSRSVFLQRARRPRKQSRFMLVSEQLEARAMLAGDVHVTMSNGDLLIRGDQVDNQVSVAPADAGGIQISGNDGTLINGQAGPSVVFQDEGGVPDDFVVQLSDGSNQIDIDGIDVGDNVSIYAGAGQDAITLDGVTAGNRITVSSGFGDDLVRIIGSGDDAETAKNLYVYASGGNNTIGVSRVAVSNDIYLRTSGGDDVVSAQEVRAGDDLRLYGSTGDDTLAILDSSVADDTTLETGPRWSFRRSSDTDSAVILNSTHNGRANIDLGSGQDFLGVREIVVGDDVSLRAGSGDDKVGVQKSVFGDRVSLDGGSGDDGLLAEENDFSRDPSVKRFESGVEDFDAKVDAILETLADAGVLLPQLDSITEIVVNNDDFSDLEAAVVAAGLAEVLASDGEFTVFAPTNSAFDALPDDTLDALLSDPEGQLKDILLYHAGGGEVFAEDLVHLSTVETLLGSRIKVEVNDSGVVLNGSVNVTTTDIVASNGVIHVIDAVLIPPGSITEIVVANENFSTLEAAVVAAGLAETLDGAGEFTVFAPTNAAFEALPEGTLDALLADPEGQLRDILLYHAAGNEAYAMDIVEQATLETLLGSRVTVEVNDSGRRLERLRESDDDDIVASNGVIHVIDAVLIPPGSITEIVVANEDFSTLEAAVVAAGLAETLDGAGNSRCSHRRTQRSRHFRRARLIRCWRIPRGS